MMQASENSRAKAASMKMFGKLTRETVEWHPDKLLCKRFNIANPYPEYIIVFCDVLLFILFEVIYTCQHFPKYTTTMLYTSPVITFLGCVLKMDRALREHSPPLRPLVWTLVVGNFQNLTGLALSKYTSVVKFSQRSVE